MVVTGLAKIPTWREIRGAYGRGRRALRQTMLQPLLVGWPALRDVVMRALSARGHLVLCELGDVRFFVDPSDRVVGAWLMWHGGWQRREIDTAVDVLSAAQRLPANAVFVDVGAHIGTHTIYALRTGRFARAVAFEPAPRNADLLARNLEANGLSHAAVIVPKAAGPRRARRRARLARAYRRRLGVLGHAGRRNRQDQELDRNAGADHRPGRAAARREHRRDRPRDGEFRPQPAAPGQAARRLAQYSRAPRRLRCRPHSRSGGAVRHAGGGDRRLHARLGHHGARP